MKIKHLLFSILFLSLSFMIKAQTTLEIRGHITPVAGPVVFSITYTDNGTTNTVSYITDSIGQFSYNTSVVDTFGTINLSFDDCNNNPVSLNEFYNTVNNPAGFIYVDFGAIPFCTSGGPGNLANFSGQFINFGSPVDFTINYEYNNTLEEIQGVCDSMGYFFFDSIETVTPPTLTFVDCHGILRTINANPVVILPYPVPYDFSVIDFCPSTNPFTCFAEFYLNQDVVIDSFNNIVNVGPVVVINSSLASSGANIISYTWDFGDGSPTYTGVNFLHSYANNGPYYLCVTLLDDAGCSSTFCDSVMVDNSGVLSGKTNGGFSIQMGDGTDITQGPTAINEIENIEEVLVYPNPAKDNLSICFQAKENQNITISILDLTGKIINQEIFTVELGANKIQWNVNDFNAGIYFLQIKNTSGSITKKLNIQ